MNRIITVFILIIISSGHIFGQDESTIEDLLSEEVFNESPAYKPVIGIGSGVFNFHGDVRNNTVNPVIGDFGYKVNVTSFIDLKRFYKLNLFFIYGQVSGNERSVTDLTRNLNFKTDIVDFGLNLEYGFNHFFSPERMITPFISAGIESIQFTPKGDLENADGKKYFYWSDGSIRSVDQAFQDINPSEVIYRDYSYERDLREMERTIHDLGKYNTNTFSIPVDFGVNFRISDRVTCKIGSSMHFTFSDFLDNVAYKGTSVKGRKGNDIFSFNYFSLHFDLFSEPKSVVVEKMFAELEFDSIMFDDEDGDFILDAVDDCPGTPYNVVVDTTGCPLDSDRDGIPDYLDHEKNSLAGVWVDDNGKTISEEEYIKRLLTRNDAMSRENVKAYFNTIGGAFVRKSVTEIPEKFINLDTDNDGYISFDELLKTIDDYFDYKLNFAVEDVYELNSFFFSQ